MAFEIHLPQVIRKGGLKTPPGLMFQRLFAIDQTMAPQNGSRGAGRRHRLMTQGQKTRPDLAATPNRMSHSELHHCRFHGWRRSYRGMVGTTEPFHQTRLTLPSVASQRLIASLPADNIPTAQLGDIRTLFLRQPHKF